MKEAFRSVRGTFDLFPTALAKRRLIENEFRKAVELFGYAEMETPILEHTFLFERGLGEGSEVVSKEMFRLESRGGGSSSASTDDRAVLRPENTASVLRSVLHAGLQHELPLHFYYCGPQFRYERPQKGRARQFHQFGVECFGRSSAMADAECILSAVEGLKRLGLLSRTTLKLNTLGESEQSRAKYNEVLLEHFTNWKETELSRETQLRIREKRILRALDSKSKLDVDCIATAPRLIDHLPKQDVERFNEVVSILKDDYKVDNIDLDPRLVRGLDYYSHTCFEFVSTSDGLTCLAGGRYDNLAKTLGYDRSPVPAIGWAAGLERLVILQSQADEKIETSSAKLLIVPLYEAAVNVDANKEIRQVIANIATQARTEGVSARIWGGLIADYDKNSMKKALREADHGNAIRACFVGMNEIKQNKISLRKVATGEVITVEMPFKAADWFEN